MANESQLVIRIPADLRRALEERATEADRTVSYVARQMLMAATDIKRWPLRETEREEEPAIEN